LSDKTIRDIRHELRLIRLIMEAQIGGNNIVWNSYLEKLRQSSQTRTYWEAVTQGRVE